MNKKKICVVWLVLTLLFSLPLPSFAIDSSQSFRVSLTVDGNSEVSVQAGREFSVTVTLERMDAAEDWFMYAWQTEVSFDSSAFELVEDSIHSTSGVGYSNHPGGDENRVFFSAYSISKNGRTYPGSLDVGSFTLKARKTGTFRVWNKNYLVGTAAGADRYPCESSDLSIIVTEGSETPGQNGG